MKKCPVCKKPFNPYSSLTKTCSIPCAIEQVIRDKEKVKRKRDKVTKETLKTLRDHLNDTQKECNAFIRERDKGKPCISCNKHHTGQYHAGHYRSIGAAPHLRFDPDNIHNQCAPCNNHKSGNAIEYRINLVKRIGTERVEALEQNNTVRKFTIDEAKRIKQNFRERRKKLTEETSNDQS